QGVAWMAHANSKTLFTFYYAMVVFQGAAYAALYGFEFVRLRFPCFPFDFRIVLVLRSAGLSSIVSAHYIIVTISLEVISSSPFQIISGRSYHETLDAISKYATAVSLTFVSIYFAASHRFELVYIAKDVATIDLKIPENSKYYEVCDI
ncbi:hypothetical protein PENTCL1PPCAC_24151, partial [Pristionchus entomophagus]